MNTVEPLQENGTSLICVGASQALAAPVRHLVAEVKPLFFHQDLEALQCPAEKDNVPNTHKRAAKKISNSFIYPLFETKSTQHKGSSLNNIKTYVLINCVE